MTTIKFVFNEDVRRFKVADWEDAKRQVAERFGLTDFTAKYLDEDLDAVTISSDVELEEAIENTSGILRVKLSKPEYIDGYSTSSHASENEVNKPEVEEPESDFAEPEIVEPEDDVQATPETFTEYVEATESENVVRDTEEDESITRETTEPEVVVQKEDVETAQDDETSRPSQDKTEAKASHEQQDNGTLPTSDSQKPNPPKSKSKDRSSTAPENFFGIFCKNLEDLGQPLNGGDLALNLASAAEEWSQTVLPQVFDVLKGINVNANKSGEESAEESSKETDCDPPRHHGVFCDVCNDVIVGNRYKCKSCNDYDMCETCLKSTGHPEEHILMMIRKPVDCCAQFPMFSGCRKDDPHGRFWHGMPAPPPHAGHYRHHGPYGHQHCCHDGRPHGRQFNAHSFGGVPPRYSCAPQPFGRRSGRGPAAGWMQFMSRMAEAACTPTGSEATTKSAESTKSSTATAKDEASAPPKKQTVADNVQKDTTEASTQERVPPASVRNDAEAKTKEDSLETSNLDSDFVVVDENDVKGKEKVQVQAKAEEVKKVESQKQAANVGGKEKVQVGALPEEVNEVESETQAKFGEKLAKRGSFVDDSRKNPKSTDNDLGTMQKLYDMGFHDRKMNAAYIRLYGSNVEDIAQRLSDRK
eukprot:CFRG6700T1